MKAAQELNSGKENQIYFGWFFFILFWNIYINKNITPESKQNQQRPLHQKECCVTIAAIFIVKI